MSPTAQRVAIVTGGSGGVGAAVARSLAATGAAVLVTYGRSRDLAEAVVRDCVASGGDALAMQCDVARVADCEAAAQAAQQRWGKVDALVNCAGATRFVSMADLDAVQAEEFHDIYAVNAIGPYQMSRAAARHMGEGSSIVNVSSISAQTASGSSFPYVMSKAALNVMTLGLARALAPRVRVNAVLPGMIEGNWMRGGLGDETYEKVKSQYAATAALGCICQPEEIASAVCWLLEPGCMMTGQQIVVDAGFMLGKPPSATGARK